MTHPPSPTPNIRFSSTRFFFKKSPNLSVHTSIFLILFLQIAAFVTMAQDKNIFDITGTIVDSATRQPIEYASVAVFRVKDSLMIGGAVTTSSGAFTIHGIQAGRYLLKSNFIGYKTGIRAVTVGKGSVALDKPIELASTSIVLGEVQVTDRQNAKQITIEKTKIDVSQNISSVSGNITDVLKSQANISIDAEDNVYLRGSSKILLLIDGRPTTVTSLNAIPSASVENIEIVTNPDAKYDAEGTGGIINIITKKNTLKGFSGSATVNYGLLTRVNGGISLNYSKGIWDVGFSYSGRYEESTIRSTLERQLIAQQVFVSQDIHSTQVSPNQNASLLISVRPWKKNIFTGGVKLIRYNLSNSQNITGEQTIDSIPVTEFNRRNEISWNRKTIEASFSYKRIFVRNKHEISLDALYSQTKGSRPADYYIDGEWLQKSDAGGSPTNFSIQADYFRPMFHKGKIETGLKAFSRWNNFNSNFYDWDSTSQQWILNPAFSNDLEHQEYIYSGYLMYGDSLAGRIYYKAGVRLEYSTSTLNQNSTNDHIQEYYLFPFPYLLFKYKINKVNQLGFSLTRRVTRPTYGQLNPFIVVIDQMTFETGNKYLQPETLDKIELNHTLLKKSWQLRSNFYLSTAKDFITQITFLTPEDDLIVTYANGSRQNKAGIDLDATVKLGNLFSLNPGFSAWYAASTGEYQGMSLNANGFAWTGNIKFLFKPDSKTDIQLFLNYNSPVTMPQFLLYEIYYADFGVKRTFWKNKLSVSLTLTDILNTRNWIIRSDNSVYNLYNKSKYETRVVWLGLTFNLNSFKSARSQKNEGSENEQGLIKIGQ
jgi:outer membrane receptor protein involved in Fe transport